MSTTNTPELLDAAKQVVARWAAGDLGEAVRNLAAAILESSEDQAPLPPAGISVYAVPMFHALRRIQIESSPEAEATAGDLRRALLQINRLATEALR